MITSIPDHQARVVLASLWPRGKGRGWYGRMGHIQIEARGIANRVPNGPSHQIIVAETDSTRKFGVAP